MCVKDETSDSIDCVVDRSRSPGSGKREYLARVAFGLCALLTGFDGDEGSNEMNNEPIDWNTVASNQCLLDDA